MENCEAYYDTKFASDCIMLSRKVQALCPINNITINIKRRKKRKKERKALNSKNCFEISDSPFEPSNPHFLSLPPSSSSPPPSTYSGDSEPVLLAAGNGTLFTGGESNADFTFHI
ncbi:unnamed protein product [Lupinus luteus]|uniref:Uncharacterized protein n=1 Tax=Lupinus luteus TaxID=3873 RepID=A0AAV1WHD6_LUPLU